MKAQIGSISHGTLRAKDLIDTFAGVLADLSGDDPKAGQLVAECNDYLAQLDAGDEPIHALEEVLIEDLTEALNDFAPDDTFFGAHEGDNADFGFWPVDQDDDEEGKARGA